MNRFEVARWFPRALAPLLAAGAVACGSSSGGPSPSTTTDRFVGTVEGTNVLVGLVVTDGKALLFFCGKGDTLASETHWLRGSVTVGQAFNLTDGTATATGDATSGSGAAHLTGTYKESASADAKSWSVDLTTGSGLSGVYTDQLSQGLVALIVVDPGSGAPPVAQGAFHVVTIKEAILQVTPLNPLSISKEGLAVDVEVSGATEKVFLAPAVGD